MTDYAKHTREIESLQSCPTMASAHVEALAAAIEAMRELAACKAKLARVEAWMSRIGEGDPYVADLRAALADSGEKT